jgi:asparaginyl-tRNA synthetase
MFRWNKQIKLYILFCMENNFLKPPKSWEDSSTHHMHAINSEWYRLITKLQSEFVYATVDFYSKKNMVFMFLPITTGSVSSPSGLGSDSKPVKVNILGQDTYLVDSMQFYLEYSCRLQGKGCFYIAPSFRGEKSNQRHLNEFFHSEAEIFGDLNSVINFIEEYITSLCNHFLESSYEDIVKFCGTTNHIKKFLSLKSVPRCTFEEAVKILDDNPLCIRHHDNIYRTITKEGERRLMEHFQGFVWLTHFDHLSVPFYQKSSDSSMHTALCADLLMGVGETVGSGERHSNGLETLKALQYHNVSQENYDWYIKMKDQVPVQTSGFGMGIERFLLWLISHDDIRDIPLLPRLGKKMYF